MIETKRKAAVSLELLDLEAGGQRLLQLLCLLLVRDLESVEKPGAAHLHKKFYKLNASKRNMFFFHFTSVPVDYLTKLCKSGLRLISNIYHIPDQVFNPALLRSRIRHFWLRRYYGWLCHHL